MEMQQMYLVRNIILTGIPHFILVVSGGTAKCVESHLLEMICILCTCDHMKV